MEEVSSSRKPLGCDPNNSLLFAQVISGEPKMIIDGEGFLRSVNWHDKKNNVYLGDVANVSLRSLGPHDPPKFIKKPDFDEQRWVLTSSAGELKIKITSDVYWGFGLFSKCFFNIIELTGPLSLRARCVHDIMASLGRNPWEASRVKKFEKETNATISQHGKCWEELVKYARDEMEEEIKIVEEEVKSLIGTEKGIERILELAKYAIEDARAALLDRNAPAVERALGRAITALIEAKPNTEVRSSELESLIIRVENIDIRNKDEQINASDLLKNDIDFVDLTESE
ncbi:MAG: hypothetical protein ISR09_04530 [Candidatus Thalassarchaeum sp.]|nr:hypothetical protein [Candidatus Thalassarchaeum sp.]MDB3855099.1 hypothetical protein [Euryarchaeota archaeon]MDB4865522.1 hypothetical protein [Euryarchaeota archaeon]MDC3246945.1 hypothetical protein [Euryarchaeota archaeon]